MGWEFKLTFAKMQLLRSSVGLAERWRSKRLPRCEEPRIGAVIVSRNDDYGGNLVQRASYALRSAAATFDKVVYVDWNSDGVDLLTEVSRSGVEIPSNVSLIRVSSKQAARLVQYDPDAQPCCEVLGRNLGMRRLIDQQYDYIVSTNVDVVQPGRDLLRDFVRAHLAPNLMITVSRLDALVEELSGVPVEAPDQVVQVLRAKSASFPRRGANNDSLSLITCCGDFQIASAHVWQRIRGFEEDLIYRNFADTSVQVKAMAAGFDVRASEDLPIFHLDHGHGSGGVVRHNSFRNILPFPWVTKNASSWGFANDPEIFEIDVDGPV